MSGVTPIEFRIELSLSLATEAASGGNDGSFLMPAAFNTGDIANAHVAAGVPFELDGSAATEKSP